MTGRNGKHPFPHYPNLVQDLVVVRPDRVWVCDVTYIRLLHDFLPGGHHRCLHPLHPGLAFGMRPGPPPHLDRPAPRPGLSHPRNPPLRPECSVFTRPWATSLRPSLRPNGERSEVIATRPAPRLTALPSDFQYSRTSRGDCNAAVGRILSPRTGLSVLSDESR